MVDINIGAITESLNYKSDLDLGNVDSTGKTNATNWCIPDYANGVSKLPNTDYTAEFSGRLICCTISSYGGGGIDYITVNGQVVSCAVGDYAGYRSSLIADISKGDSFRITKNTAETGWVYTFYPFRGNI